MEVRIARKDMLRLCNEEVKATNVYPPASHSRDQVYMKMERFHERGLWRLALLLSRGYRKEGHDSS